MHSFYAFPHSFYKKFIFSAIYILHKMPVHPLCCSFPARQENRNFLKKCFTLPDGLRALYPSRNTAPHPSHTFALSRTLFLPTNCSWYGEPSTERIQSVSVPF